MFRGQHRAGFGDAVEEYTTPFAGLTPTASAARRGLFQWRDAFGRSEIKPYPADRFLPLSRQVSPLRTWTHSLESETPLAFVFPNSAQPAPAEDAVLNEDVIPRALSVNYVCDATTRRVANISRALILVQLIKHRL